MAGIAREGKEHLHSLYIKEHYPDTYPDCRNQSISHTNFLHKSILCTRNVGFGAENVLRNE
uniref:AlNc14C512G12001 protein n=1 Tax=Albugo laibachii Nc14 TaxID=890382 RepID=F0X0Q7_9STRA|nr:AlNc14C512G12001 [Albugo laibachii Nc14]|eukprot:CCA27351.1 AlNc14C512G12001 [Albugo laibachii Nc14]